MQSYLSLPLLAQGRKKKWSYSSLLFSLFYFVPLYLQDSVTISLFIAYACAYLIFVALYIYSINQPVSRLPFFLVAIATLTFIVSVTNPGGAILFGYLGFIVGYYYTLKTGSALCIAMVVALYVLHFQWPQNPLFFLIITCSNVAVLFAFGFMERKETLHTMREEQQAMSIGQLSAIAERERIGRDLHDIAGHALSGIALKAHLADKLMTKGNTDMAQKEIQELAAMTKSLLSEIRQTVSGIKHLSFDDTLAQGLSRLSEGGFHTTSHIDKELVATLSPLQETQLTLIIKECITNIVKHSNGDAVQVSLKSKHNFIELAVTDNGTVKQIIKGNGLAGICERADLIHATVDFSSGTQTAVVLLLPKAEVVA